jgi:hypothetical protein
MNKAIIAASALLAATMLSPGAARADGPCSGTAAYVNGHYVVQQTTPAGGIDSQCEILVTPSGLQLQNGGDREATDGVAAPHESQAHGS